tara:strand:+ start:65 stop:205 length:141 start_codon:yes stop_codon:yes gene_type:complete
MLRGPHLFASKADGAANAETQRDMRVDDNKIFFFIFPPGVYIDVRV